MATNKRTFPNTYFTWYNDDNRIAILAEDTSSTGERTTEKYDTYQGTGNLSGNITATNTSGTVEITSASHGLTTGDRVTISGTTTYDGNKTITYVDVNTFSITDTTSGSNEGASSGVTWTSLFIDNGLRITYHSKYEEADATTDNLQSDLGLDSALHNAVVCYVKARLYEDDEDIEYANYYRQMYEQKIKKFRGRRSAVRHLAVTRL
jgi:hypothetical protein